MRLIKEELNIKKMDGDGDRVEFLPVWVLNGGLTLFNYLGTNSNQNDDEKLNSTSNDVKINNNNFGIRLDWDVNQEHPLDYSKDPNPSLEFFAQDDRIAMIQKKSSTYNRDFLHLMHKNYPSDVFQLFFSSSSKSKSPKIYFKKREPNIKSENSESNTIKPFPQIAEIKGKLYNQFHPDIFGITFISHAHADHCPSEVNLPNKIVQSNISNKTHKNENLYPFPIFSSNLTQDLIKIRFKRNIINYEMDFQAFSKDYVKYYQTALDDYRKFYIENICEKSLPVGPLYNYFLLHRWKDLYLWLIPAGHVVGSAVLCVISTQTLKKIYNLRNSSNMDKIVDENGNNNNIHISKNFPYAPYADFIYLGEICPIKRKHCYPLPNINCESLVVDTLFANPNLNFPNQKIELDRLTKWIFNEISEHPVVIFCGELGKPQLIAAEILSYLKEHGELNTANDFCIVMPKVYTKVFSYLSSKGWKFPKILSKSSARKEKYPQSKNYLLIVPSLERDSATIKKFIQKRRAVTADVTGWCYQEEYREKHSADEYFTITDHITYSGLLEFLQRSKVKQIFPIGGSEIFIDLALKNEKVYSQIFQANLFRIFKKLI